MSNNERDVPTVDAGRGCEVVVDNLTKRIHGADVLNGISLVARPGPTIGTWGSIRTTRARIESTRLA